MPQNWGSNATPPRPRQKKRALPPPPILISPRDQLLPWGQKRLCQRLPSSTLGNVTFSSSAPVCKIPVLGSDRSSRPIGCGLDTPWLVSVFSPSGRTLPSVAVWCGRKLKTCEGLGRGTLRRGWGQTALSPGLLTDHSEDGCFIFGYVSASGELHLCPPDLPPLTSPTRAPRGLEGTSGAP